MAGVDLSRKGGAVHPQQHGLEAHRLRRRGQRLIETSRIGPGLTRRQDGHHGLADQGLARLVAEHPEHGRIGQPDGPSLFRNQDAVGRELDHPFKAGLLGQKAAIAVQAGNGAHARQQLGGIKRLADEVIGPGLQPEQPRGVVVERRHQQHGHQAQPVIAAQPPARLKAIQAGHHHV